MSAGRHPSPNHLGRLGFKPPHQPVRQWVLSFPYLLRFLFASRPVITGQVLGIVNRVITTHLVKKAGYSKKTARTGAVTLIQRFGSALNLNIHFHMLFLDGVYVDRPDGSARYRSPIASRWAPRQDAKCSPCRHCRLVNPMITLIQQAKHPVSPCMRALRPDLMSARNQSVCVDTSAILRFRKGVFRLRQAATSAIS